MFMLLFGHVCSFASANMQNLVHHTDTDITVKDLFSNFTVSDEAYMITTFKYSMKSVAEKGSQAAGDSAKKGRRSGEESIVKHMDVYNKICREVFERRRICLKGGSEDQENEEMLVGDESGDDSTGDGKEGTRRVTAQDRIKGWYQAAVEQLGRRNRGKKRKVRAFASRPASEGDVEYDANQDYDWLEEVGEIGGV